MQDRMETISNKSNWLVLGKAVPRQEVVYFTQVALIFMIVVTSVVNLMMERGDEKLWIALLCSSIGYLLPNPSLKTMIKHIIPDMPDVMSG